MPHTEVIAAWLDGAETAVVAPFTGPSTIAAWATHAGRDVVVLTGSEVEAVLVGASSGLPVLIRATPRLIRDRWYARPAGQRGAVVTSIDSLHSPVLREELGREAAGVPWVVLAAGRLEDLHPNHAGRRPWLEARRADCRAGGLLSVFRDRRDAPADTPVVIASAGAVRSVERGDALVKLLAMTGGGVLLRRPGRSAERTYGEAGLSVRGHRLDSLRVRNWEIAEAALRNPSSGVDAVDGGASSGHVAAGRWTVRAEAPATAADLAVERGSGWVVDTTARLRDVVEDVTPEQIAAARAALGESAPWLAIEGGVMSDTLLFDLVSVGFVAELRPTFFTAVIADQRRFRPPFTDREDAYRELHAAYATAASGWSLSQRADLALTDRAPRDLRSLGLALDRSPADLCDVLSAMNHDSVVTVRLEPTGNRQDWVCVPGAAWAGSDDQLASAVNEIRLGRRARADEVTELWSSEECWSVRIGVILGAQTEICGGCDRCAASIPPGYVLSASKVERVLRPTKRRAPPEPAERLGRVSPGDLFAGLGGGQRPTQSVAGADRLRRALSDPLPAPLLALVGELGAGVVLAQAAFRQRYQGRARDVPDEIIPDILEALAAECSPTGLPALLSSGTAASRGPRNRLELQRSDGLYRGLQSLDPVESPGLDEAVSVIAESDPNGSVALLSASMAAGRRWGVWTAQLQRAAAEALNATGGIPELADVLPDLEPGEPAPGWSDLFALVALAKGGAAAQAAGLAEHAEGPETALLRAVLQAVGGRWDQLWVGGRDRLRRRDGAPTVVARLELRALLALDPPPELTADELLSWFDRTRSDAAGSEEALGGVLNALRGGRRRSYDALAEVLDGSPALRLCLARRALELGTLGRVLASELAVALVASDSPDRFDALADLLLAAVSTPEQHIADAAWTALPTKDAELLAGVADALQRRDDPRAVALVEASERRAARIRAADEERDRLRAAGAQGRLQAFGATLAKVLAPADGSAGRAELESSTREALMEAHRDGWLAPILKVLRAQVRRHPSDPERTIWFARALAIAGQWAEADRAFAEAADAASSPEGSRARRIEGAHAFLIGGEVDRGMRLLRELLLGRPDRAVASALVAWAEAGEIPGGIVAPLCSLLTGARSGVYAGAIRALDKG